MLSRHVNQHFSASEDKSGNGDSSSNKNVAKKSTTKGGSTGGASAAAAGSMCPYRSGGGSLKGGQSPGGQVRVRNDGDDNTLYLARKSAPFPTPSSKKFSSSTKNLKRAGIRLKFRQGGVFSARNFDFFDPSVMPGLRHAVYDLQTKSYRMGINFDQEVSFVGTVMAVKSDADTKCNSTSKSALVRWSPANL